MSDDPQADGEAGPEALVARMAAGDEAALGALYDAWVDRVHTVAIAIVHDADEAEEVVADTFWQAWRSAAGYARSRGTVAAWLLMIARTRAVDRLRASRRRNETATTAASQAAVTALQPEPVGDRDGRLAAALAMLPVEQRQVVEMAFLEGMTRTEIAAAIGQPVGTVKTRLRLAMEKLRHRVEARREVRRREARG